MYDGGFTPEHVSAAAPVDVESSAVWAGSASSPHHADDKTLLSGQQWARPVQILKTFARTFLAEINKRSFDG